MNIGTRIPEKWYLEYLNLLSVVSRVGIITEDEHWVICMRIRSRTAIF